MRSIFMLITLLYCFVASAQNPKEKFYNEEGKEISKKVFSMSLNHSININSRYENDSLVIYKLHTRKKFSEISESNMNTLRNYLSDISGRKNDSTKIIVINYYPGRNDYEVESGKSTASIYRNDYIKAIKRRGDIEHYWVYKSPENLLHQHSDRLDWIHDKKKLIERIFFPYFFNYGSTAVIMPDGKYYTYFGEYGPDEVFEGLNQLKKNAK